MSKKTRILLAVVLLVAILAVYLGVYRPRSAELARLSRKVAHADQRFASAQLHSGDLQEAAAFLPDPASRETGDAQRFLSLVNDEVRRLGLRLNRIEPLSEKESGPFTRRQYRVSMEGTYRQVVAFMGYLEALPDLVTVEALEVRSSETRPGSRHDVTMSLWVTGY